MQKYRRKNILEEGATPTRKRKKALREKNKHFKKGEEKNGDDY